MLSYYNMRRLRNAGLGLSLVIATVASAQTVSPEFSGYVVNLPVYRSLPQATGPPGLPDREGILDLSRLRLRPGLRAGESTSFMVEYELTALYVGRAGHAPPAAVSPKRQLRPLRWTIVGDDRVTAVHFLDRLYLRHDFSSSHLTAGRQRIAWGTGRIWNPTDLFNPINPASFEKIEKDGADAVTFKHYFASFTDAELVWNPEDDFRRWNGGGRFRTNYGEFDVSVMGGRFDGGMVAGADFAGNLFDAGVRGEILYSGDPPGENPFIRAVAGIDYQFTPEVYCLAEYFHNGNGAADRTLYDPSAVPAGGALQLGRDYLYLGTTYLLHPLITGTVGVNLNMNDRSGFVLPEVSWSAASDVDVAAGGLLVFGGEGTEYRYYPASFFGRLTAWF